MALTLTDRPILSSAEDAGFRRPFKTKALTVRNCVPLCEARPLVSIYILHNKIRRTIKDLALQLHFIFQNSSWPSPGAKVKEYAAFSFFVSSKPYNWKEKIAKCVDKFVLALPDMAAKLFCEGYNVTMKSRSA